MKTGWIIKKQKNMHNKIIFKNDDQLFPVIIQNTDDNQVLMLGYTNREAFLKTKKTGEVYLYSRKNKILWHKGATSGNRLKLNKILLDCDGDALIYMVTMLGKHTCHHNRKSCFELISI